jgi:hypothetical protein
MKSVVISLNRQPAKRDSFSRLNAGTKIAFEPLDDASTLGGENP